MIKTHFSFSHDLDAETRFFLVSDWHDGGDGRVPPDLDKVMNEGIAFVISRFVHQIPKCPIGQRPVMIGRRKRAYDTLDKVMKRLDLIIETMGAMNFIVIDVH